MGTWGYEPRDGDSPLDGIDALSGDIARSITKMFSERRTKKDDSHWLWSRIGVVQVLSEEWRVPIPLPVAENCLKDLEEVMADPEFVSGWSSPAEFAFTVRMLWGWLASTIQATVEASDAQKAQRRGKRQKRGKEVIKIFAPIFGSVGARSRRSKRITELGPKTLPAELARKLSEAVKASQSKRLGKPRFTKRKGARRVGRAV